MRKIIIPVVMLFTLICFAVPFAMSDDTSSRIDYIQASLDEGTQSAKRWQYGWTTVYGGATFLYSGLAVNSDGDDEDEEDDRYDATVSAISSLIGFGGMVLDPLVSWNAADKLRGMPAGSISEKNAKLDAAEDLLFASARREKRGRSWKTHALSGLVNVLAGIAVASDDGRGSDGLLTFATGMLVSEIQIFTTPQRATEALARYNTEYGKRSAFYSNDWKNNLYVTASPNLVQFHYFFD